MGSRVSGAASFAWASLALVSACSGTTPPSTIPATDLRQITVFYPIDGLVQGAGRAGAFPPVVTHVMVRALPTGTESIRSVERDGSFAFSIIAISGDILEIAGATDAEAGARGQPTYVRVPPTPLPPVDFVCCRPEGRATGTCQQKPDFEARRACPDPLTGIATCTRDADCGVEEGEFLRLFSDQVQVARPDAAGRIAVAGAVAPGVLVKLENRGLRALGAHDPGIRVTQIANDTGRFSFPSIPAQGDDELVIQLFDLLGFKSPAVSFHVPDAELAGVDVVGAFAWDPLTNGKAGTVAIQVSPFGRDGRGICPDSDEDPVLCFSGGLTHGMLRFVSATLDNVAVNPTESGTTAVRILNRGHEGDVRGGPQDVVLALDMSGFARMKDGQGATPPRRFDAAQSFIEGLGQRVRVGVVAFAETAEVISRIDGAASDHGLRSVEERPRLVEALETLERREPEGVSNLFAAVEAAASVLDAARSPHGRIVVIAAAEPQGLEENVLEAFERALARVARNESTGFPGYSVDVAGLAISPGENFERMRDMTGFTGGAYYSTGIEGLDQTLTDLRGLLQGNFFLLYDMLIPESVGKAGTIRLEVELVLGDGQRAGASYTGPLRVQNSSR